MGVIDRKYFPADLFKVGNILYTNGYCQMENGDKIFIQKTLRITGFEGSYFPEPIAIFKPKKHD